MNLDAIRRDDWLLGGVAFLLAIDLLFLPWFDVSIGPFSFTSTATRAPDGWLGVFAVLSAVALIADLAIERLSPQTRVPTVGGSRATTRLALAGITGLFVALKFLFHVHFSLFGVGFWGAVVLTAVLVGLSAKAHRGEALVVSHPASSGPAESAPPAS
ncbi:MAG TPA: hypothetical protein VEF89_28610 [Solirubrobacteraceae bacterium]|nr:hypothetical protein [Solirubrobacteraceae bacterium]